MSASIWSGGNALSTSPPQHPPPIGPGAEFLHDPRRKPRRRIRQAKAQGLRPRALNRRIGGILLEPVFDLVDKNLLLGSGILDQFRLAANGQEVDVNADQLVGMRVAHARGGDAAPVPALN